MKQKWYSVFEGIKLPLGLLMISYLFIGVGNYFSTDNNTLTNIIYIIQYLGVALKNIFPLVLMVGITSKKQDSAACCLSSIICYFVVLIVTMVLANQTYAPYYYDQTFGFHLAILNHSNNITVTHYPINIGYIWPIVIAFITSYIHKKTQRRTNYGVFSFIPNEVMDIILSSFVGVILGAVISFGFPYFVKGIDTVLAYIAEYSTRVRGMFIYEVFERILSICGYDNIVKNSFWFGQAGGNWVDALGNIYYGDINVWTAQTINNCVELGFGKYVTPHYVFNMFVVPTIIVGLFLQIKNPTEKSSQIGLVVVAIVASLLTSSLLPVELLLLFTAPILLGAHILISSGICSLLFKLNVQIGYSFNKDLSLALPGNLIEFFNNRSYSFNENSWWIILVFGVCAILIYALTIFLYYRFISFKLPIGKKSSKEISSIENDLGGITNIEYVEGGFMHIVVAVKNEEYINFDNLVKKGYFNIEELRYGLQIGIGPGSNYLARQINKNIKNKGKTDNYIID